MAVERYLIKEQSSELSLTVQSESQTATTAIINKVEGDKRTDNVLLDGGYLKITTEWIGGRPDERS